MSTAAPGGRAPLAAPPTEPAAPPADPAGAPADPAGAPADPAGAPADPAGAPWQGGPPREQAGPRDQAGPREQAGRRDQAGPHDQAGRRDQAGPHDQAGPRPENDGPPPELAGRLAYLLKHAQLGLAELTAEALAPFGVSGRELAVLTVLAGQEPGSQQQAAQRLGVDRTTMVGLVDALEDKGLVRRRAHAGDRRRNVVEVTEAGRDILDRAGEASVEAERRFLAPLSARDARHLKNALLALIQPGR